MIMTASNEPKHLRHGKGVHKRIQKEWHKSAEGSIVSEKTMTKPSGRKGRMDIFVASDETLVAVAEIKCSKWDAMTLAAVRRNVSRQARQIWDYIESQLELGKGVSPGVIFPKLPKDPHRMKLVEQLFNEEGIAVVWEDETATKRKARSQII
jgi:hypothetical protein